ncbi:MAG TPA: tetratricopeptide repeat protein [Bacteroidales bacterium]|nr:tetratricopeptide repeat protein [Bacteroidales bacterium]
MNQKRYYLILLIVLPFIRLNAGKADSLEQVLPNLQGVERVDALTQLTRLNSRRNHERAFEFANEAIELAQKINYQKGIADALLHKSTAYYFLSDYNAAIGYLKQSLEIRKKLKDTVMVSDAYNKVAINSRMLGNFEDALAYSFDALRVYELRKDSVSMSSLYNNIGGIYKDLGNIEKALEYYSLSYVIAEKINHQKNLSNASNNLGIIYRQKEDYEKALEYYEKSLEFDLQQGNQREIAQSYNNIGNLYLLLNDPQQAMAYFEKSLDISIQINNPENQAVSLLFMGDTYFQLRQYEKALDAYADALAISRQTGNLVQMELILKNMIAASTQAGNYEKAIRYYDERTQLKDSIRNQHLQAVVSEIEAKYELEKKTGEIEKLTQENLIKELKLNEERYLRYGFGGLTFAVLIIAMLLIQRNKLIAREKSGKLEQKLFRTQMNPHFIYNALFAIQSYVYKSDPQEAGKYISNFARLMRLVLTNSREEYISLESEINTLEYYLQLQRLRFDNKFDYHIELDPAIQSEIMLLPPMLAQPFIENSIEHGIQHLSTRGKINISFRLADNWIHFTIEDNGIGIKRSKAAKASREVKHESLALSITEERLKLLNQSKHDKINLNIVELTNENNEVSGTSITFHIPYRTMADK